MAEWEAGDWILVWVEDLHRWAGRKCFWEEEQELMELGACCLILSCNQKYGLHADCHSGMGITKSRCFFVKQAVHPCWYRRKLVGRVNNTWFHSRKALFDCRFYLLFKPGRNKNQAKGDPDRQGFFQVQI